MRVPLIPDAGLRPAPRGGFAPATLLKTKPKNLSKKENHENYQRPRPSRWSGPGILLLPKERKNLPELVAKG